MPFSYQPLIVEVGNVFTVELTSTIMYGAILIVCDEVFVINWKVTINHSYMIGQYTLGGAVNIIDAA